MRGQLGDEVAGLAALVRVRIGQIGELGVRLEALAGEVGGGTRRRSRLGVLAVVIAMQWTTTAALGAVWVRGAPVDPEVPPPVAEPATPAPVPVPAEMGPPPRVAAAAHPDETAAIAPPPPGVDAVRVEAFPFRERGDTRASGVRRIDRYGCAPDLDESGAEVWYRLELAAPARVVASIAEDKSDGFDVDLHLLTGPEADACVARDNARVSADLPAGTAWLVVDTFAVGGREKPGPYRLTITTSP